MCGIVGFIESNNSLETLQNMLKIQSYRGPDDKGIYFDESGGVYFGHNRLSIQDLSSHGHQPFISDCGNYTIVFNGEVYNFKDIRLKLEKLGYKFISSSDTEVILYSYKEWGVDALKEFIGMFTFAIFDKTKRKLFLARDRAGVKPLYYYTKDDVFIFSSEIKSFHKHPSFKKELNKDSLPYYFQFGYIPAPNTIFQNCYKLEAGHFLEYDLDSSNYTIHKYWDAGEFYSKPKFEKSEKEILDDLENILDDAVSLRMIADVPVGVFLSGGYDSSLVSALLAKKHNRTINTFTIGFNEKKYNEAEHAKTIAEHLNTNHTEYYMKNSDMFELIDSLPFYYDEPFGDSSALPTMVVSKMAREKVTVALSADGGDEAFCGYSKYFFLNKFSNIFNSGFKKTILKTSLNITSAGVAEKLNEILPKKLKQTNIKDKYNKFKRSINSKKLEEMFQNASSYVANDRVAELLKLDVTKGVYKDFENKYGLGFLDYMMLTDYKKFMNDDVLTKVDRATMSVSLEGREPLLDHRIIEFMSRVPNSIKYKNNQGKYLLRQILYKYIPSEIIDKPKAGFQIPLNEWLRGELKYLVEKYINKEKLDGDIFNMDYVLNMKEDFLNNIEDNETQIWFILMYQMWKEKWFD